MKKYLLILLLIFHFAFAGATKYYIDEGGSDATGNGSISNPWASLAKAASSVTIPDTIFVNAGTYDVGTIVGLGVGVHVMGEGNTSILSGWGTGYFRILNLYSAVQGTSGNQSISYLKFEGNLTAWMPIYVSQRSNVKIHHCTFQNFLSHGPTFKGRDSSGEPTTYATGNEFYNNVVTNCSEDAYSDTYQAYCNAFNIGGKAEVNT